MVVEFTFWIAASVLIYTYLGYGVIIGALALLKRHRIGQAQTIERVIYPEVTLLIAAYNEIEILTEKISNIRQLNYPVEKLKVLFVTDGSTDGTDSFLRRQSDFSVLHEQERKGKSAALNRAMKMVHTPIVVFTDANTILHPDALVRIVQPYQNAKIGAVSGEKRVGITDTDKAHGAGEGLYWQYESKLKHWDSQLNTVVGAAGELFSIRTELYETVPEDTILDDFIISLRIVQRGFSVAYVPEAYALEMPSASLGEEMKRKIRICAGGFQAIMRLPGLLNVFNRPLTAFQYISHRVLRWVVAPFLLPVVLLGNIILLDTALIFTFILVFQVVFYLSALLGWYRKMSGMKQSWLFAPLYFLMMNASAYIGFWRFIVGGQSSAWVRVKRAPNRANV